MIDWFHVLLSWSHVTAENIHVWKRVWPSSRISDIGSDNVKIICSIFEDKKYRSLNILKNNVEFNPRNDILSIIVTSSFNVGTMLHILYLHVLSIVCQLW